MSTMMELRSLNPKLRGAMNRRDSTRKHVRKYERNVKGCDAATKQLQNDLDAHKERTEAKITSQSVKKEFNQDMLKKAQAILKDQEGEVLKILKEMGVEPPKEG